MIFFLYILSLDNFKTSFDFNNTFLENIKKVSSFHLNILALSKHLNLFIVYLFRLFSRWYPILIKILVIILNFRNLTFLYFWLNLVNWTIIKNDTCENYLDFIFFSCRVLKPRIVIKESLSNAGHLPEL